MRKTRAFLMVAALWAGPSLAGMSGDVTVFGGFLGNVSPLKAGETEKPLQYGAGLGVNYMLGTSVWLGLSTDFRLLRQGQASTAGSLQGKRWNWVSPVLGFAFGPVLLKLEGEFLGNLNLNATAFEGEAVFYAKPLGGRATLSYKWGPVGVGLYYETIRYRLQKVGVVETTLAQPMTMWQSGLSLSYLLGSFR